MIEVKDVYVSFRQAQSRFLQRPYRIPKDWDAFYEKMSESNKQFLEAFTASLNTRLQNIDVDNFFDCGFELHGKNFSYNKFLDKKIILLYIQKDKIIKQKKENTTQSFEKSKEFVEKWMENQKHRDDIPILSQYCKMKDNNVKAPIKHFLLNKIDNYYLVWLISKKFLSLTDEERMMIPYITQKYWKILGELKRMDNYIK